jgi:phosphoinositide-3-kinase regulatory subunit 4
MGNSVSTVTPSAATAGIDSYVSELGDIHYDKRQAHQLHYHYPPPLLGDTINSHEDVLQHADSSPSTYDSLGSARFMKTIRGRQREGTVVVKIFVKPESGYSLKRIARKLNGRPRLHIAPIEPTTTAYFLLVMILIRQVIIYHGIEERDILSDVPNAIAFQRVLETDRAGYLIRQYFFSSLYDRIRYRAFCCTIRSATISCSPI